MARENKQARNERRFGKAERLIDLALDRSTWTIPSFLSKYCETPGSGPVLARQGAEVLAKLRIAVPIVADNVSEYIFAQNSQEVWCATKDFPCCSPPYPVFFIECGRPSHLNSEGNIKSSGNIPRRWGWLFESKNVESLNKVGLNMGAKWALHGDLFIDQGEIRNGKITALAAQIVLFVGADGVPVRTPTIFIPGLESGDEATHRQYVDYFDILSFPSLLAISFMHCKNVITTQVNPDPAINRERKKGGLKPFVRYHTINIEPMKKVLRTEGNVETEGLKKALHICRGHFSHYSEEKPLFGRIAGTFWIPAHVRGSVKEGIVVSDYNVNPQKGQ